MRNNARSHLNGLQRANPELCARTNQAMLRGLMGAPVTTDPSSNGSRTKGIVALVITICAIVAFDLTTKAWAWSTVKDGPAITLIENWAYFEFGFNTGSAFSFLADAAYARHVFIAVTLVALGYMGFLAATLPPKMRWAFIAIGAVMGGALGNLHDRLFRISEVGGEMRHGVVDFIKVYYWPNKPWPTFNVADVALVVGLAALLLFLGRGSEQAAQKKDE
jgi:signal peptidase II